MLQLSDSGLQSSHEGLSQKIRTPQKKTAQMMVLKFVFPAEWVFIPMARLPAG